MIAGACADRRGRVWPGEGRDGHQIRAGGFPGGLMHPSGRGSIPWRPTNQNT